MCVYLYMCVLGTAGSSSAGGSLWNLTRWSVPALEWEARSPVRPAPELLNPSSNLGRRSGLFVLVTLSELYETLFCKILDRYLQLTNANAPMAFPRLL